MADDFSLHLFCPLLLGKGWVAEISPYAPDWQRGSRSQGGYWQGSFTVEGLSDSTLEEWFYDHLGAHLEEWASGLKTWEGKVYEMELEMGGDVRRRSLDAMFNSLRIRYTLPTGASGITAAATQAQSIARYGRREEVENADCTTVAAALAQRDRMLKGSAWPRPLPVQAKEPGASRLQVSACGYSHTANWRFATALSGATVNASTWVNDLLTADCSTFLSPGSIATNALQVTERVEMDIRTWDLLMEIVACGDASGNHWRLWVGNDRKVHYTQVDVAPRYYRHSGLLFDSPGSNSPVCKWMVEPAVVRDMEWPSGGAEPGSFLSDVRDIFVEGVQVSAGSEAPMLTTALLSKEELLAAQIELRQRARR